MKIFAPEFSRIIQTTRITPSGLEEQLEANEKERKNLAQRFDVVEISSLKAELSLFPASSESYKVSGKIEADIVQKCIVTLEPLHNRLSIPVDLLFCPSEKVEELLKAHADFVDEGLDYFSNGKIDLGEMVAQFLGVSIDPYPRKADVALDRHEFGPKIEQERPLAKLSTLLKGKEKKAKTKD